MKYAEYKLQDEQGMPQDKQDRLQYKQDMHRDDKAVLQDEHPAWKIHYIQRIFRLLRAGCDSFYSVAQID